MFGSIAAAAACASLRGVDAVAAAHARHLGAARVAVACPFCSVMLNDAVTKRQAEGTAEGVEVVDIATLLLDATARS